MSLGKILAEGNVMRAVKATFKRGRVTLSEKVETQGPVDVLVVFPEAEVDPWEKILNDPRPRPKLNKFVQECLQEIAQGKAKPLRLEDL